MIMDIHESTGHGIRPICAVLGVPRSSYYHASEPSPTPQGGGFFSVKVLE